MAGLKRGAAHLLLKGGLQVVPRMSDEAFLGLFEKMVREVRYPDGQDFVRHMLACTKHALSSPQRKKGAGRMLRFIMDMFFDSAERREAFKAQYGFSPPPLMVISPSMTCNLRCYGCYAGEYSKADDLPFDVLDRVVNEAKQAGIGFIVVSGGEPFFSDDVLRLWEKHRDIFFQVYTNGTLIDKEMAQRLAEYGNVVPCISVEGYEEETDKRRGKGTYAKIMAAMDNLSRAGVLFGFSATATQQNNDLICSDEFVDYYAGKGCFVGWYFNYIPIGRKPDLSLMPTPEQRIHRWNRLREMRHDKEVILADFWCDGSLVGGCMAGGRNYFHVNNRGDVEPCVFAHFAVDNIRDKPLAEALGSAFFRTIRSRQPYSPNLLRPCMIIDLPEVLRDVVNGCAAHPTHPGAETIINELAAEMDRYAACYCEVADRAWKENVEAREVACGH